MLERVFCALTLQHIEPPEKLSGAVSGIPQQQSAITEIA